MAMRHVNLKSPRQPKSLGEILPLTLSLINKESDKMSSEYCYVPIWLVRLKQRLKYGCKTLSDVEYNSYKQLLVDFSSQDIYRSKPSKPGFQYYAVSPERIFKQIKALKLYFQL